MNQSNPFTLLRKLESIRDMDQALALAKEILETYGEDSVEEVEAVLKGYSLKTTSKESKREKALNFAKGAKTPADIHLLQILYEIATSLYETEYFVVFGDFDSVVNHRELDNEALMVYNNYRAGWLFTKYNTEHRNAEDFLWAFRNIHLTPKNLYLIAIGFNAIKREIGGEMKEVRKAIRNQVKPNKRGADWSNFNFFSITYHDYLMEELWFLELMYRLISFQKETAGQEFLISLTSKEGHSLSQTQAKVKASKWAQRKLAAMNG